MVVDGDLHLDFQGSASLKSVNFDSLVSIGGSLVISFSGFTSGVRGLLELFKYNSPVMKDKQKDKKERENSPLVQTKFFYAYLPNKNSHEDFIYHY